MAYNNGREDRKWRIWKEAEEKVLREHGVAENERVFHKRDCPACAFNDGCYLCTVRPS